MRGLPCRVSGQGVDYSQLFVEDVTRHSDLNTQTGSVIDFARNPTYVILDLGCTKSMGSRYAVNKFMRAAHVHGLDYEIEPSTSKFSFANSETTTVHQARKVWFPTKPPMITVGGHCGTRTSSYLVLTSTNEEPPDATGYAS